MKLNEGEKQIKVDLADRSYPINIGVDNLLSLPDKLKEFNLTEPSVVITNPEVISIYKEQIVDSLNKAGLETKVIEIISGEESKTIKSALSIIDELIDLNIDRMTPIIAFGGGVIGDLTGYVAATFMRGLPYIQVPTTLLAQLDSSVGGKVAVNRKDTKNIIGSFYQPKFVLADVGTLNTLQKRDYTAGLAETIKYSLIADNNFLEYIEKNIDKLIKRDGEVLAEVVTRCCGIKARIVEADERDQDIRAVLNYGHTIGHVIEGSSHFKDYLHGEAVSIGMVASVYISLYLGYIDESLAERIVNLLQKAGLPTSVEKLSIEDVKKAIIHDKKVVAGEPRFVLLKKLGETVVEPVKFDIVKKAVERITSG